MDDLPEVLARLNTRIETLEGRVFLIEHSSEAPAALHKPSPGALPFPAPQPESSLTHAGAAFAVFGRAMLGMAGAYVLRAIAESGSFPKLVVIALAIAYAGLWLVWAERVPAGRWFAALIYAGTSAMILAPMLWESTLRFKVLSPSAAAAVLGAFVLVAHLLVPGRNRNSSVWTADLASALAAIVLFLPTHVVLPFLCVLSVAG